MSSLPHEVLILAFLDLSAEELLQCQLTCKQWYKASLTCLYADIYLSSEKKAALYVRTISKSPQLGKYLNIIHFNSLNEENDEEILIDNHDVLDTIIQYSPNITRMGNFDIEGFQLWTQLMHAATQGQLSYLKYLPLPSSTELRSYIYTALSFKNSLAQIHLYDDSFLFGPQLARLGAYKTLCDQMDQFKNLQLLTLSYISDKHLSYFDGLIDKCHHLKELVFDLIIEEISPPSEFEPAIRPRPDIYTFECNWRMIDAADQLEYVICKFPGLKKLTVIPEPVTRAEDVLNCSSPTLIKFIQYALSIPYFQLVINVSDQDLLNTWAEFMKTKHGSKNLSINYPSSLNLNTIELSSKNGIKLSFPIDPDDEFDDHEPPHTWFFSEVGATIPSLIVNTSDAIPSKSLEVRATIDWLYEILQRCPLMEEITMNKPSYLRPSYHTLKYPSVKKLVVITSEYNNTDNFLNCLSFNLPNLRQIYFNLYYVKQSYTGPITIHMPHTSLDLLTWNETAGSLAYFKGTEVYIKLETDAGIKFYVGIRDTLFQIDSVRYLYNSKHTRFDISCKQLKELRIRRRIAPESNANLIF